LDIWLCSGDNKLQNLVRCIDEREYYYILMLKAVQVHAAENGQDWFFFLKFCREENRKKKV